MLWSQVAVALPPPPPSRPPRDAACDVLQRNFPREATGDWWQRKQFSRQQRQASTYPASRKALLAKLFNGKDPYAGLVRTNVSHWETTYPSTAARHALKISMLIGDLLGSSPLRLVAEVGSFVGTSAVHVWGPLARSRPGALVLCIDTWQGDLNMRLHPKYASFMRLNHGIPTLSGYFLDRIVAHNLTDVVYPLAMTSLVAARLLAVLGWHLDAVFVDSAHEMGETLVELHMYYNLLRPGGVLLGDDFRSFSAVRHDVGVFSTCTGVPVRHLGYGKHIWYMQKPWAELETMVKT